MMRLSTVVSGDTLAMSAATKSASRVWISAWIITKRSIRKSSCIASATVGRHLPHRVGPNLLASSVEPRKPMTTSGRMFIL